MELLVGRDAHRRRGGADWLVADPAYPVLCIQAGKTILKPLRP